MTQSKAIRQANERNLSFFASHNPAGSMYYPEDKIAYKSIAGRDPLESRCPSYTYDVREWCNNLFSVGCQKHPLSYWRTNFHKIATKYDACEIDRRHAWFALQLVLVKHGLEPMKGNWMPPKKPVAKKATKKVAKKTAKKKAAKRARR